MNEDHQPQKESHKIEHYEDEIELIDILKIIWKWKYFILAGAAICGLLAASISFSMPKTYRIDMTLQPGIVRIDKYGKKIYIDSVDNIKTIIQTNVLKSKIEESIQKTNKNNLSKSFKLKVSVPKQSEIIKISYESTNVDFGIKVMESVYQVLREKYDELVKYYRDNYDNDIQSIKFKLDILEAESATFGQNVKRVQKRIQELQDLIKDIDNKTRTLIHQRNEMIQKKEDREKSLSALLYNNTIQQNVSLANRYRNDIKEYLSKIEEENEKDKQRKYQKQGLSHKINMLKHNKGFVHNIQMLQTPTATADPIKPKTKLNVILALAAGLFLMVFLSFFLEFISKHRKKGKTIVY